MKFHIYPSGKKLYFKRFTRKKFAVFFSLHKVIHISKLITIYTLLVLPARLFSQNDTTVSEKVINLEEVEVVGQKSSVISEELSHFLNVATVSEIVHAPAQSLTDILRYAGNLDIRQRGKNGIQSDVSIRGGSFDHSLILLNGVNISDPQTGHFSLDLPVESPAIKSIEILNGPGAQIYGANALSGAINFSTLNTDTNRLQVTSVAGEYGYFSGSITLSISDKRLKNLLHYNNAFSSGYYKNTDFRKQGIFYRGIVENKHNQYNFQLAHSTKAFGANSYYTPKYPDQFEENEMYLFSFDFITGEKAVFKARTYWRRHIDRFELFRENKNWYRIEDSITISNNPDVTQYDTIPWYWRHNHHINDVFGIQLSISKNTDLGTSSLKWHLRSENIISTNIGYDKGIVVPVKRYDGVYYTLSDNRTNFDLQLEQTADFHPFHIRAAVLLNWNSYLPGKINIYPALDMRLYVLKNTYLFGNYSYSQGLPTFTDLTYEDPDNLGNNELKPYSQHAFSSGLKYMDRNTTFSITGFYQFGRNVIDWVWFEDLYRFSPVNSDKYSGQGLELAGSIDATGFPFLRYFLTTISLYYTYLDMHKEIPGNVAKYFNIRHKASVIYQKDFLKIFTIACNVSYTDREGLYLQYDFENSEYKTYDFKPYWLTDMRLSCHFKDFTFYAEATNIFNIGYIDIGTLYQPGRWITGGISYTITGF